MNLNYKVFGQGEPLIILHGLLGSLDNWQTLAKQYAENFTVFIIDLRNHGKSPHSKEFSYELMADDLLEFCDTKHIYKSNLLGHSMGGKVAMLFALQNPDYIEKLIIADIAPHSYPPGHNEIFEALFSVDLDKMESREEVEAILKPKIPIFSTRQFLMKGLSRDESNKFIWKFNLEALWNNYEKILGSFDTNQVFNGEVLFIKGAKSDYILPEYEQEIARNFSKYQIKEIANVGHWLHAENPEEFYKISSEFLLK